MSVAVEAPKFLDTAQAAEYIGTRPQTLRLWRCSRRQAIPHFKIGDRVKYKVDDLDRWLESRRVGAVAEAVPA